MSLSTEVKKYVLITLAGTKHFLTTEQEINLRKIGKGDSFVVEGAKIWEHQISMIMTTGEYYKQFPEEAPEYRPIFTTEKPKPFTRERHIRGLENMINGFKSVFAGRKMPEKSNAILVKMESKLKEAFDTNSRYLENPIKSIPYIFE